MPECNLSQYVPTPWIDHITDIDTAEVIQQGTPINAKRLNHLETGIEAVTGETLRHCTTLAELRAELQVIKDATLNNMTNNVFVLSFDALSSVDLQRGIYDPVIKKIYA